MLLYNASNSCEEEFGTATVTAVLLHTEIKMLLEIMSSHAMPCHTTVLHKAVSAGLSG